MAVTPRPWSTLLHPTRSLRARLGLFFGGLSVTLAVLLAFALGSGARRNAERTAAESLSTASAHMSYVLEQWLAERFDDIHVLARLPRLHTPEASRGGTASLVDIFKEYRQDYPGYLWIGLVGTDGRVIAATGPDPGRPAADLSTGRYVGRVRPLGPAGDGAPARRVLDMVVPVVDDGGRVSGAVWAMLDWQWAENVRASLEATLPPALHEAVVVARPDGSVILAPPSTPERLPAKIVQQRDPGVAEVEIWPDGQPYLTAVMAGRPQGNRPDVPYLVIAREPAELAFARPRQLERAMVAGGVGVGVVFALLGWALASRVTRPLTAIAQAAERMRAGDPDVKIPRVASPDEMGALSNSLRNLIGDLRAAQADLAAARDDAEAASRAKDRFLAVLSHELRTPLTPILIALADVETDGLPPDLRHDLEMIRRNVDLEARLIDDLLDTTRIASGKLRLDRRPTDVHEVLRYAIDTCMPDARGKGVDLVLDAGAAEHRASADPARLEQIFWNLIKNAIKFTPPGGTITVRTRNEGREEGQVIRGKGQGKDEDGSSLAPRPSPLAPSLVIEVTDTGIGIPPASLPYIFKPFEQGDSRITRQFGGLGLGLAISKSLAESHGGTLTASSPGPHLGSTFALTLPALVGEEAAAGGGGAPRPAAERAGGAADRRPQGLNILLVEDHADTARLLARILRARGHTVTTASSVSDALAAASGSAGSAGASFDVVISDLGLPDGSGTDVMRGVRSTQPQHPPRGIAVSGYGTDADKRMTREAGFEAHLTKPIRVADLEPLLRRDGE